MEEIGKKKLEDREKDCKMLSSGHRTASAIMMYSSYAYNEPA